MTKVFYLKDCDESLSVRIAVWAAGIENAVEFCCVEGLVEGRKPPCVVSKEHGVLAGVSTVCKYLFAENETAAVSRLFGVLSDHQKAQVDQWLSYCNTEIWAEGSPGMMRALSRLNSHLLPRTFVAADRFTLADIVLCLKETMEAHMRLTNCCVVRWFDFIQNLPEVKRFAEWKAVAIDLRVPVDFAIEEGKAEIKKNQEGKDVVDGKGREGKREESRPIQEVKSESHKENASPSGRQKEKKEKKSKAERAEARGVKQPKAEEPPLTVARLDLRVGHVQSVEKHPGADTLFVETVDIGEDSLRTVVSGLVNFMSAEDLMNRKVVCVCNMKPVKMRGIASAAMVLAASSKDKSKVELVDPPAEAKPGMRVSCAGFDGEPDGVLNPKKKIFESVQPDLSTNEECVAVWRGVPLMTSLGVCTVKSLVGATIK